MTLEDQKAAVIHSFAMIVEDSLQEAKTDPERWLEHLKAKLPHVENRLKVIEQCYGSQKSSL